MSHVPHELDTVFPEDIAKLDALKAGDARFRHLADDYHTLNREIHRAETDVAPVADHALEDMKKRRLALLDEIRGRIATA